METKTSHFKAEIAEMLDLVVNSLYSKKEIFLRELISNASDAIDRAKYLGLTEKELVADNPAWGIEIAVDKAAGCINLAADAQDRFNEAMKQQALHQIEQEMLELQKNIRELGEENESLCGFWVNAWNTITFRMGKAARDIEANGEKIDEAMSKLADARKRQQAILNGDEGSLTGGKSEKEQLEAKVTEGR